MRRNAPIISLKTRFFIVLMCCLGMTWSSGAWELKKQYNGIALYTQSVADSVYVSAKLETVLETDLQSAVSSIGDGTRCNGWIKMCRSVKLLEQVSEHELRFYTVLDFPFPLKNRDSVMHVTSEIDEAAGKVIINMNSVREESPRRHYIRMHTDTRYTLQQLDNGHTQLIWEIRSDPGGGLKPSLFNKRMPNDMFKDLQRLKDLF